MATCEDVTMVTQFSSSYYELLILEKWNIKVRLEDVASSYKRKTSQRIYLLNYDRKKILYQLDCCLSYQNVYLCKFDREFSVRCLVVLLWQEIQGMYRKRESKREVLFFHCAINLYDIGIS
jgi:hypothetical protein